MFKFIIFLLLPVLFTFTACATNKRATPESTWEKNVATLSSYQVTPNMTNVPNMTKAQAFKNVRKVLNLEKWKDESTEKEIKYSGKVSHIQKYPITKRTVGGTAWQEYEIVDRSYFFEKQFYFSDIRQVDIIVEEDSDKKIATMCAINPFLCPAFLYIDSTSGRGQIFKCRITLKTAKIEDYNFMEEYDARLLADSLMVLANKFDLGKSEAIAELDILLRRLDIDNYYESITGAKKYHWQFFMARATEQGITLSAANINSTKAIDRDVSNVERKNFPYNCLSGSFQLLAGRTQGKSKIDSFWMHSTFPFYDARSDKPVIGLMLDPATRCNIGKGFVYFPFENADDMKKTTDLMWKLLQMP